MPYKDLEKRKEFNKEYQKEWREKNKEKWREILKKSESRPERKEYLKKWWNESPKAKLIKERFNENNKEHKREYNNKWQKENPERVKKKYAKYYSSVKGIISRLRKADKKKFGIMNGEISYELIISLDEKYKKCPYCNKDFKPRFDYDHINPFKPFSKINMIKVCSKCNQSKNNGDLIQWMKFKNYPISDEIKDIYKESYN